MKIKIQYLLLSRVKDPRDDKLVTKIAEACLHICLRICGHVCYLFFIPSVFCLDLELTDFFSSLSCRAKIGPRIFQAQKQAKLKRMIASVRKQQIKAEGNNGEARFAAMQLIDDPQGFAEMLFKKLKEGYKRLRPKCCSCKSSPELSVCTS